MGMAVAPGPEYQWVEDDDAGTRFVIVSKGLDKRDENLLSSIGAIEDFEAFLLKHECLRKHLVCILAPQDWIVQGTGFELYFERSPWQTSQYMEGLA